MPDSRHNRPRTHAPTLRLSADQAGRHITVPQPARPAPATATGPVPKPPVASPSRPEAAPARRMPALVPAARRGCCQAVRSRQVMEGGGILLLTRHAVDCPVWSTR